ncbi:efflux RND transporter permease subunit [Glaciecola petra]|uniref:Efflux RND transporter permease subunit n=1 Tax=Glaciecola petra TaxID=3075602 RepID=A0ABU2ZQH9_9ALTE|nr:efflux RND transporter permease subunit [Aestuariibacter sp. P117]MDT0594883.1 efflux RND transporter permease subunit [Aestuariibacter sp. P117]
MPRAKNLGLIGWFTSNSVVANLLMITLIGGGIFTLANIKSETFPEVDPRTILVSVNYPGASPTEIENAINRRVEELLVSIEGIKRVKSAAKEGNGTITAELTNFANSQSVKDDIEQSVSSLADFPPSDAEEESITISTPSSRVMRLAVAGDLEPLELYNEASRFRDALLLDPSVSSASLSGVLNLEISIEVSQSALKRYDLKLSDVAKSIENSSLTLSGGTLKTSGGSILLKTNEERYSGEAFNDIVIVSDANGGKVLLEQIATVYDGFSNDQLINTVDNKQAIFVDVGKGDDQDAFDIKAGVERAINAFQPGFGVEVSVFTDDTTEISERIDLLLRNCVLGLALVFMFLALTLDMKIAFWTTTGIFIAFLGGFIVIGQFTTINMVSLFALIVVLGIVVDDAVVVAENIQDKQINRLYAPVEAAAIGAQGVISPVTIGVLTTVTAFSPLLFTGGTLGQILQAVPIVVIAVLAVSFLESFCILPSHLAHQGQWSKGPMENIRKRGEKFLFTFRDRLIMPTVRISTRFRYVTLALFIGFLIVMFGMLSSGQLRFIFFPVVDGDNITVNLEMAAGTAYEETERTMNYIVNKGYETVGGSDSSLLKSMSTTIGGSINDSFSSSTVSQTNIDSASAEAVLALVSSTQRKDTAVEIANQWRDKVGNLPGVKELTFNATLLSGGDDISINLSHENTVILDAAVESIVLWLSQTPGVYEISASNASGTPELEFKLTPLGIASSLTTEDIARQIRNAYYGYEVQRIQRGRDEVVAYVRLPSSDRQSLASIERFMIQLPNGESVFLEDVATIEQSFSPLTIDRVNGRRIVSITADVDESITTPNEVNGLLKQLVLDPMVENDLGLIYEFEGMSRDQAEDISSLLQAMSIAMFVIYFMLAAVFKSYFQPLIIMASIPVSAGFAFLGHVLMGYDLSFISMFGIVALSGVTINGGIVMIDYFNQLNNEGTLTTSDSIVTAVSRRFRPLFLTTITTFFGLIPMLLETSPQAMFLIPMAISLGFGILFTGFAVLALTPALVMIGDDIKSLVTKN